VYFAYGLRHSKLGRGETVVGEEITLDRPAPFDS